MVDQLYLHEIGFSDYHKFIVQKFEKAGKEIDDTVVHDLLHWTRQHTFYVQVICNKLYGLGKKKIESRDLIMVQQDTLKELEMNFINIKRLMSVNQYKTLRGIAKEGTVTTVRSKDFTKNYNLAASTAQQSLEFLLDKEMIYEKIGEEKTDYQVYDLFLSKWLELS